jgi:hypothetical protein
MRHRVYRGESVGMLNQGCVVVFASGLMSLGIYGAHFDARVPGQAHVIRRFPAPEASQAVAVDSRSFYAIASAAIGKYEKTTGQPDRKWVGDANGPIAHLNSGVVFGHELYCAHSNYPHTPMESSIEVFDTERMTHIRSMPLPAGHGSATWIDYGDGSWWVTFAQYSGNGGEPGKGSDATTLVRFSNDWRAKQAWSFPPEVVARWGEMSSSGGTLGPHRVFYTTGHDAPELYAVKVPRSGRQLVLEGIVPIESEGQGIAIDRDERVIYSIQRRTKEVLVSVLPRRTQ